MSTLEIRDLHVNVEDKEILKGVNLTVNSGEIHALMGPNGNGKSTLLLTVMGHPRYKVTQGTITLDGQDVLSMSVDARSKAGLFIAMQYPQEVPGVTNSDFLKAAVNAHREKPVKLFEFIRTLDKTLDDLQLKSDMAHRFLNEGFSGGEKKRNEIVQMKLLKPQIAMMDEIDSGLDVDDLIKPTHAHVLINGRIVIDGDADLARKIDAEGYEWLLKQENIELEKEEETRRAISLGTCAANVKRNVNG